MQNSFNKEYYKSNKNKVNKSKKKKNLIPECLF